MCQRKTYNVRVIDVKPNKRSSLLIRINTVLVSELELQTSNGNRRRYRYYYRGRKGPYRDSGTTLVTSTMHGAKLNIRMVRSFQRSKSMNLVRALLSMS